jgi:hypothetical protein
MPVLQKPRNESPTYISGTTCDQDSHADKGSPRFYESFQPRKRLMGAAASYNLPDGAVKGTARGKNGAGIDPDTQASGLGSYAFGVRGSQAWRTLPRRLSPNWVCGRGQKAWEPEKRGRLQIHQAVPDAMTTGVLESYLTRRARIVG